MSEFGTARPGGYYWFAELLTLTVNEHFIYLKRIGEVSSSP